MEEDGPFVRAIRSVVGRQAPEVEAAMLRDVVQSLQGGSMGKKRDKKGKTRAVTEFTITFFNIADLEADTLLDLYADHAYKFAERHGMEHPTLLATSYPTVERWEES